MGKRKVQILHAIIDDYIITAEPVGSRTIAKKHGIGISSATIRNEMADLEEMGFLEQPYTSAGRIPSDKAYRLYVDSLMKVGSLSTAEADFIKRTYDDRIRQIEQIVIQTARALSDITNYTSLVVTPVLNKVHIRHVQLVPVDTQYALLIVVTNSGIIKDTLIPIPKGVDNDYLIKISNIINECLKGKEFTEIDIELFSGLYKKISKNQKFFNNLVDAITESMVLKEKGEVFLGGASNIFNFPEYQDILKAKAFIELMEEREILYSILSKSDDLGISITIGEENEVEEMKECSIITATYGIGDRVMGTIGIIGPTRMKYSKTVSVMDYMGKNLSSYLTKLFNR